MDKEKLRNALRADHTLHWYRIERVLGQGGFGITYLAYDTNLEQHVAIKEYLPMELAVRDGDFSVYPASQAHDTRYRWGLDRFLAEARTLARFKHPAIVRVLSVFEANNTAYMVMEYQQGLNLQEVLEKRSTLPESELIALVMSLLDGLEVIHAQGFIHRDIKPANIFIRRDGHPVLLDFGSARQALGEETRTLTSVISPGYAPFEQYYSKSDRQGPWTDIYGLGATLYRCLSGRAPMAAIDRSEAILKAERDTFVSAAEIGAGTYSRNFLAAVDSALHFNEKKRPQTVAEWRQIFALPELETEPRDEALPITDSDQTSAAPTQFSAVVRDTVPHSQPIVRNPDSVPPSRTRSARRASAAPRDDLRPAPAPRYRGPRFAVALALLAATALGTAFWAWQGGWLPADLIDSNRAQRLVQQGDRALAAGQDFSPAKISALAYYRRAWEASPGNEEAADGLGIVAERLIAAIDAAIANDEHPRIERLAALLDQLPPATADTGAVRARLADADAHRAERARQDERISSHLAAAEADLAAGRLVGPGTENALARYRAVQVFAPGNSAARSGLERLAAAMAARGQQALASGELDDATDWHARAQLIDAALPAVAELEAALEGSRQAHNRDRVIDELLAQAEADFAADRLTSPAANNALDRYRRIIDIEPDNADAARGIRRIHDRYLAMAAQALARESHEDARQFAGRAVAVLPDSAQAATLAAEIDAATQRRRDASAAQLAADQQARAAAQREQAARARAAAEQDRRRAQTAEAERLAAAAERRAEEERLAREAEIRAREKAENGRPRIVFDYDGFDPKYSVHALTRDTVQAAIEPLFRNAGYDIVKRDQVHDAGWAWTNVKLVVVRLYISENTATGLFSWISSLDILNTPSLRLSLAGALEQPPEWTQRMNGLGAPTELRRLVEHYTTMARSYVAAHPARIR